MTKVRREGQELLEPARAGAGQRDRLLLDAQGGRRGDGDCSAKRCKDRPVFAYHAGMDLAARTSEPGAVHEHAAARSRSRPTRSAWASTSRTCGWSSTTTSPARSRRTTRKPAARAATGSRRAACMLFSYQDRYTQEFFIDKIGEESRRGRRPRRVIEQLKQHAHGEARPGAHATRRRTAAAGR